MDVRGLEPIMRDSARVEQFWKKVARGAEGECWPWLGYVSRHGYGRASWRVSGMRIKTHAHRAALAFALGSDIPRDRMALHDPRACSRRDCCNPAHLRIGTALENQLDRFISGTQPNAKRTACHRGHDYTADSRQSDGSRKCIVCRRANAAIRRARKRLGLRAEFDAACREVERG